ncbi:L-seryl-tRNA(Sec) selenium transferase [Halalkalibacter krulwichiae]|uniref:L-seryl-tRNA(Sec) selenium transferase n=1 Tax=Halalkalibacter krulwichiae TaxID=199441 RepID=UPI000824C143|nr:L-seryl-tRNA(Sec) selenium transferase [Halalkalibacter krulwichiae]
MHTILRQLPAIHELQQDKRFISLHEQHAISQEKLTDWLKEAVQDIRKGILADLLDIENLEVVGLDVAIFDSLEERLNEYTSTKIRRVINGTGTVLHTNFGRARLSSDAIRQVVETARSYSNLEYNLDKGQRGSRHELIEEIVRETTGAEAAMVVNNNAAAVYLVLKALAKEREVIVSRGELVEIGGSFRVSSIMEESGAKLVEVGTTNKTHLYDYEHAISEETAMIMKVHTSNFKIIGFTKEVEITQLEPLAKQHDLILYEDLGSGAIYDLKLDGIGNEPTVAEALQRGVDIVTFSGDKLLGGPQAGIIAGKKKWIDLLKKHQLARVLRVDKMTLAALEATLKAFATGQAPKTLPTLKAIKQTWEEINTKIKTFETNLSPFWLTDQKESVSQVGGGTMPEVELKTTLLLISNSKIKAQQLHDKLRNGNPAVVGRIIQEQFALDFRTVEEDEFPDLLNRFIEIEQELK